MKNKKTLFAVLALVLVAALMLGAYQLLKPSAVAGGKTITVTVIHSDGASKEFTYHTDAEYLGEVILTEGLVEGEDGPYGLVIHAVDGEEASWEKAQAYWGFFVNGDYAIEGMNTTEIEDGAVYKLEYTVG